MKTPVTVLLLVFTFACSSNPDNQVRKDASEEAAAVSAALLPAESDISIQILRPNNETVIEIYSLETETFEVRASRPLRNDEYFWVGTSNPFVAYVDSYPEIKPLEFRRFIEKVEVTGGKTGTASFSVTVMESTRSSKSIASAIAGVRVLPVPEEDSVTVRKGDTIYGLSEIYLNDPEKWREVKEKNPFLEERGRVFKRSGKVIVVIKPGEKLNGLARLGVKVSR